MLHMSYGSLNMAQQIDSPQMATPLHYFSRSEISKVIVHHWSKVPLTSAYYCAVLIGWIRITEANLITKPVC